MDYPNGLHLKNNNKDEYYLMFLTASIIKLHITSAYVHPNLWRAFGDSLFDNYEKVASSKKHTQYFQTTVLKPYPLLGLHIPTV